MHSESSDEHQITLVMALGASIQTARVQKLQSCDRKSYGEARQTQDHGLTLPWYNISKKENRTWEKVAIVACVRPVGLRGEGSG
jgi:hypothetical protein